MNFKKLYFEKGYKEKALLFLKDIISYPSVLDEYRPNTNMPFGKANKEVLEYVLKYAKEDGFEIFNADNYAGHIEYGSGELLGVLCHLDVVPVNNSEWKTNPFSLTLKGDKFYARGVVDDKGPFAASYIALKMLYDDEAFYPSKKIRLIFGCDEESGSRCLEYYFKHIEKPKLGFSPDAEFPLINGEKGMISYDLLVNDNVIETFISGERYNMVPSFAEATLKIDLEKEFNEYLSKNNYEGECKNGVYSIKGLAAHAMCPEKGINAAYLLFDFLYKYSDSILAKYVNKYFLFDTKGKKIGYDSYDPDMKELTSNFAVVDIKDGKGRIGINCRVPKNEDFELIEDKVSDSVKEFNYDYKILSTSKRHYVDPNSRLIKTLMKVYKKATGSDAKPFTIGGGTYAREIEGAVAYGPLFEGREDVCHIANEYMYADDFEPKYYFFQHPDSEMATVAFTLDQRPYELSKIYQKQAISENIQAEVTDEMDDVELTGHIGHLINELKLTIMKLQEQEILAQMKLADNSRQYDLLVQYQNIKNIIQLLNAALGRQ